MDTKKIRVGMTTLLEMNQEIESLKVRMDKLEVKKPGRPKKEEKADNPEEEED